MSSATYFAEFLEKQCVALRSRQKSFLYYKDSDRAAVIVEPRKHPFFEAVVRNVMYHLGEGWNLHIWTSEETAEWLRSLFSSSYIEFHILPFENMNRDLYNVLLMDPFFWIMHSEEHLLLFQTDVILFRGGIDSYIGYDYIGANYYHPQDVAPEIGGIQGGFSLRRKSAMLDCLSMVHWSTIFMHRRYHGIMGEVRERNEDIFFTYACEILKKKTLPPKERVFFAIEADYHSDTMGHHGWNKPYFSIEQACVLTSQNKVK